MRRICHATHAGPKNPSDLHKPTLVLDLDETLVHSSFKPIPNPDYIIPVDIDGKVVDVYVLKVSGWLIALMIRLRAAYTCQSRFLIETIQEHVPFQ